MSYFVVEIFSTLQGEGSLAGTPSIFIRLAGCNLWTGHDDDRASSKIRSGALCPLWCDTDFRKGIKMSAEEVRDKVLEVAQAVGWKEIPLIVLTGGEPLMQLDYDLLSTLGTGSLSSTILAVETNGTVEPKPGVMDLLDHVCVSPKVSPDRLVIQTGTELKVVWPAYDPEEYEKYAEGFDICYISPLAKTSEVGVSIIEHDNERRAVEYCLGHPKWRLSTQQHKHLNLP